MSDIDNLPDGWTTEPLGEISSAIQYGYTAKSSQEPVGPRLLRITDIQDDSVEWAGVPFCMIEDKDKGKYLLEENDFVFARTGATVGKSYLIRGNFPESVFASYLIRVRLQKSVADPKYVACFFKSLDYWQQISENQAGIGQPNVNGKKLAQIQIPIAPLEQQKRIVAEIEKQFSRLDEAVANLKRVKANLKRYKAAVLKAAVEGELTEEWRKQHPDVEPADKLLERILAGHNKSNVKGKSKAPIEPDTSQLPTLPNSWGWATLDQLTVDSSIGLDRGKAHQNSDGDGYPYIKMNNVTMDGSVLYDDLVYVPATDVEMERYSLVEGDLLFNTRNSSELVGKVGFVRQPPEKAIYNNNLMRIRFFYGIYSAFICAQMCSKNFRKRMELVKKATTNVAAVYAKDLFPLQIALPSSSEQQQIIIEVESRLSIASETERQIDVNLRRADRLRQSILNKAFSGKLVPQDPNDEPASALLDRFKNQVQDKSKTKVRKSGRKSKMKNLKVKKNLLDVIKKYPDGITPESLLVEANYSLDDIDMFYEQLALIRDLIEQEKPSGEKAYQWPEKPLVILKPKGA